MPSWELLKYNETNQAFFFKKKKKIWNYSPCLIYCIIFEKYFSCYALLIDQVSLVAFDEIFDNMCIAIVC